MILVKNFAGVVPAGSTIVLGRFPLPADGLYAIRNVVTAFGSGLNSSCEAGTTGTRIVGGQMPNSGDLSRTLYLSDCNVDFAIAVDGTISVTVSASQTPSFEVAWQFMYGVADA